MQCFCCCLISRPLIVTSTTKPITFSFVIRSTVITSMVTSPFGPDPLCLLSYVGARSLEGLEPISRP